MGWRIQKWPAMFYSSVTRLQPVTENLRIETVHKIAIKYVNDEIKLPLIILDTQSKFSGHLILAFDSLIWGFCRFNITDRILHGNKTWYLDLCRLPVTMIDVLYVHVYCTRFGKVFTTNCILNKILSIAWLNRKEIEFHSIEKKLNFTVTVMTFLCILVHVLVSLTLVRMIFYPGQRTI